MHMSAIAANAAFNFNPAPRFWPRTGAACDRVEAEQLKVGNEFRRATRRKPPDCPAFHMSAPFRLACPLFCEDQHAAIFE
jgi:hypothetical protein